MDDHQPPVPMAPAAQAYLDGAGPNKKPKRHSFQEGDTLYGTMGGNDYYGRFARVTKVNQASIYIVQLATWRTPAGRAPTGEVAAGAKPELAKIRGKYATLGAMSYMKWDGVPPGEGWEDAN